MPRKLKFTNPPMEGRRRAPYDWDAIAEQLRSRPGEYALIFENDRTTYVTALKAGSIAAMRPEDGFEFETRDNTRNTKPRTCTLYARYVERKSN